MLITTSRARRFAGPCALVLSIATLLTTARAAETDILINGVTYVPFSTGLAAGTPVYLNADSNSALTDIRSTQRSLGYREVDYKALFSATLAWSAVTPTTTGGITTYDYSAQGTTSSLVGFWKDKNLPILIGPDGHAYITDGHHTTAGYLAAQTPQPRTILPGMDHIVLGTISQNLSTGPAIDDSWWQARQSANNAYLYATGGNALTQPGDPGYAGLQPVLPSTLAMPTVPGKSSMTNDPYRGLTWGMADGIVKTGLTSANAKIPGYKKSNPATPGVDINFVEFYWSDFIRNRVTWDDTKTGSALSTTNADRNLIAAPLSFFAAVANGIALAKSEVYRDQYGRSIGDYDSATYAGNTQTWAHASITNGLAKASDTYHLYLLDDSTVSGEIAPSALSTNRLHIDSAAGQTIAGGIKNVASVDINKGGSIATAWKDATLNTAAYNSTLTIAPGTATVTFTAANTYTGATNIGAGTLALSGAGSIASSSAINVSVGAAFDVTASSASLFSLNVAQSLKNNGTVTGAVDSFGTIGGSGLFNGAVTMENGSHLAPGNSPGTITFSLGLTLQHGAVLDFEIGSASDEILITGGLFTSADDDGITVNFSPAAGFTTGNTYTLIDWTGATPADLSADDFKSGALPPNSAASFAIVGNTLQATVIPEPGACGLLAMGALALLGRRRRK